MFALFSADDCFVRGRREIASMPLEQSHFYSGPTTESPVNADPSTDAATDAGELLQRLSSEQDDLIAAQLQQMRELAVLNRMSDALAQRRDFDRVLFDAALEASTIVGQGDLWIIIAGADGKPETVTMTSGPGSEPVKIQHSALPLEVRDLFDRIAAEHPAEQMMMPHYDPEKGDGVYVGLTMASQRNLFGALVYHADDPAAGGDSYRLRLLQSMLHHAVIGCENARLMQTLSNMMVDVVIAMALAIESRDPYTGGHVMRVTAYSLMLAEAAGVDDSSMALLRLGGLLHDIGKVGVPDAVLRKPGKLDDEEFELMKSHAVIGHQIIKPIPQLAGCCDIIRHHHEKYDGRGYPDKLAGTNIPYLARLTAIADSFDAMTSDRPYRKGMPIPTALAEISRCAGTHFGPELSSLFVNGAEDRFARSVESMQAWLGDAHRTGYAALIDKLDLGLPRLA